jgi:hypothetical protein
MSQQTQYTPDWPAIIEESRTGVAGYLQKQPETATMLVTVYPADDYYPVRAHISRPGHWSNYVYSDDAQAIANRMNGSKWMRVSAILNAIAA